MAPRSELTGKTLRVSTWAGMGLLLAWLLVQNTALLILLGSRLEWGPIAVRAGGVWKIVEVLIVTMGPELMGGTFAVLALTLVGLGVTARRRRVEERHA